MSGSPEDPNYQYASRIPLTSLYWTGVFAIETGAGRVGWAGSTHVDWLAAGVPVHPAKKTRQAMTVRIRMIGFVFMIG